TSPSPPQFTTFLHQPKKPSTKPAPPAQAIASLPCPIFYVFSLSPWPSSPDYSSSATFYLPCS
ncbi:hypothetical protein NPIL_676581, partial [Nephila pilipes]